METTEKGHGDARAREGGLPVQLVLTPALAEGLSRIEQCSWCGLLVCTTDLSGPHSLGPCPACGCTTWWRQRLPVGPFRELEGRDA